MNWHSGFSGLVVGCAAITCVGGGPALLWGGARGAAFIEWGGESSFCENVCSFIEWTPNTNIWATELLALGSWAALALSSDRQEDGLAGGGERESRRGLLRWHWSFLPGLHAFLRTSGSCRGAVAVPTAGAGLGISLRWAEPGADEDLDLAVCCWKVCLGMTHGFGALLSLRESLSYGLHGITKEAGGNYRSVQQHLTVGLLEVSQV